MAINTTAFGEAIYPHLTKPDTFFKPEGEYHLELKVKKEEALKDVKIIDDLISKQVAEEHQKRPGFTGLIKRAPLPYKFEGNDVLFKFKCKAKGINSKTNEPFTQKPTLVDHNLDPIPDDKFIWGGSIMRINYEPVPYSNASVGIGVSLRLKGAQISKIIEGTNNTTGFEPVEPMGVI